jgi:hypothetical protein
MTLSRWIYCQTHLRIKWLNIYFLKILNYDNSVYKVTIAILLFHNDIYCFNLRIHLSREDKENKGHTINTLPHRVLCP